MPAPKREHIMAETTRHICGISGGKDSSALAVYLRFKSQDMGVLSRPGAELPETTDTNPP